jgi:predicted nucleic acid-binding protein
MKKIIDSSVWIALFLDFDSQHEKAIKLMSTIDGVLIVPYCVATEVITVLTYKHSVEQALGFISYIENNNDIELIENNIDEEIKFFQKKQKKISFTDHSLWYLAKKHNAELLTFDKQLENLLNF